jgi:hypothetical protein
MDRPDTYILELNDLKKEVELQIMHCMITLNKVVHIQTNVNYAGAATALEKSNIAEKLEPLITNGKAQLEALVWE